MRFCAATYVEVVVHLDHGRVNARAQTLRLAQRELCILRRVLRAAGHCVRAGDAQLAFERTHDPLTAHAAQHARRGGAHLHVVLPDRGPTQDRHWHSRMQR